MVEVLVAVAVVSFMLAVFAVLEGIHLRDENARLTKRIKSLEQIATAVSNAFFEADNHLHNVAKLAGIVWDNGTPPGWVKKKK